MKNALTKKHDLVGVSIWTYGCAAVRCFLLFMIYLILILRMDFTGCMPRWPSTGLGLIELLLQMEAHLSALRNTSNFPMKLLHTNEIVHHLLKILFAVKGGDCLRIKPGYYMTYQ